MQMMASYPGLILEAAGCDSLALFPTTPPPVFANTEAAKAWKHGLD